MPKVKPGDIAQMIGGQWTHLALTSHVRALMQTLETDEVPKEGEQWGDIAKDFDRVIMPGYFSSCSRAFLPCSTANSPIRPAVSRTGNTRTSTPTSRRM